MDDMNQHPQDAAEAPKPSLKRLGGAAVGLLQSHLELLGIEFQEEKSRTFQLFIFSGLSLIFGLLALIGISAAILIHFWDSHRLLAAGGLALVYGLGLLLSVAKVLQLVRQGETPFHATVEELSRNREQLLP
jgi:uncharacterized membrane protein YqjE